MQDEGKDVAANKDTRVGVGLEARELLAVNDDDAGEAEVYPCGEEGRGNGEADDVPVNGLL